MKVRNRKCGEELPMAKMRGLLTRVHLARLASRGEQSGLCLREMRREEGATLVEMALSTSVLLALLFGIIEMSMVLYTYNFVAEAAREATRYAVVRGPISCSIAPAFPNCNLNPLTSGSPAVGYGTTSPLQTYIRNSGFPFAGGMNVTATWLVSSQSTAGVMTWPTPCTGATEPVTANPCNNPGYAVRTTVSYPFPIGIPFVGSMTFNVQSTSQMVISE